ncbi:chemotaxis protein, partial [Vibrio xuii]
MVKEGFEDNGVLQQLLQKLELTQKQKEQVAQAAIVAKQTNDLLGRVSLTAEGLIEESKAVVTDTMNGILLTTLISGVALVGVIVASWLALRAWINRGLSNILTNLDLLTEHNFTQ